MEHAMQNDAIRRRSNGTIDIDSYRREALTRRAQTRTQFFSGVGRAVRPLMGASAIIVAYVSALHLMFPAQAAAEIPDAIAAPDEVLVTTAHAVGAQVYECRFDSAGKLVWQFREPIATLFIAGKTVGRHYAGPNWEMTDGSAVSGKVAAQAPSAGPNDIPLLKLQAASWRGTGQLSKITTIQRLNTRGGRIDAPCDSVGTFLSVSYTADYAFYRKPPDPLSHQSH
ncbi:MAG: DUF3455 domain-containing protein [Xanthobacteraceae bacterium]